MIKSMLEDAIVFSLANPVPENMPEDVLKMEQELSLLEKLIFLIKLIIYLFILESSEVL